jgi:hypothetical protein
VLLAGAVREKCAVCEQETKRRKRGEKGKEKKRKLRKFPNLKIF